MFTEVFFLCLNFSLCCECGTLIDPNPANMCVACLRSHVDITEGTFCDPKSVYSVLTNEFHHVLK